MVATPRRKGHNLPQYTPTSGGGAEGTAMRLHKGIRLVEIFDSVQGEGLNTGEPMTFVRFSKCNLACDFCDTPYNRVALEMSEEHLAANLIERDPKWVLFTGGEPMLTLTPTLCLKLKEAGIKLTCESNGMIWNESFKLMDHVTISPKRFYDTPENPIPEKDVIAAPLVGAIKNGAVRLHELRYIIAGAKDDIYALPEDIHLLAGAICVSPMMHDSEPDNNYMSGKGHRSPNGIVDPDSFRRCMQLVQQHRHYNVRLSLQTHKFIGVR